MRGVLCMCAALALWAPPTAGREPIAAGRAPTAAGREPTAVERAPTVAGREPIAARQPHLHAIRRQILAKLGLSARPTPQRAPPRDVVRQILAHAADPAPPPEHRDTREIIAIAHRGILTSMMGWS
ncbi:unnamed protein product [Plutella xylostella]|uniref:(diamondback moth) hypothetical protein n=1 Tax=Plutella xylostella TaxID=51655 RepID=A0A8S4FZY2_PLUXY|nr:unnamed protein product [Plutella xylostella]